LLKSGLVIHWEVVVGSTLMHEDRPSWLRQALDDCTLVSGRSEEYSVQYVYLVVQVLPPPTEFLTQLRWLDSLIWKT
jgi:hypothetical protein